MAKNSDDTDLMLLVATGAALVATGTALASLRPLFGMALILVAVGLLLFTVMRLAQRQKGRWDAHQDQTNGLWLAAVLIGMMLSGGGAALSVVQFPMLGLGIAIAGGLLCGVSTWRLIVAQS